MFSTSACALSLQRLRSRLRSHLRPTDQRAHDEQQRRVRRGVAVHRACRSISLRQAAQQQQRERDARRYAQLARQRPPCKKVRLRAQTEQPIVC